MCFLYKRSCKWKNIKNNKCNLSSLKKHNIRGIFALINLEASVFLRFSNDKNVNLTKTNYFAQKREYDILFLPQNLIHLVTKLFNFCFLFIYVNATLFFHLKFFSTFFFSHLHIFSGWNLSFLYFRCFKHLPLASISRFC